MTHSNPEAPKILKELKKKAKQQKDDFGFLLTRYGTERLLYRLAKSAYRDQFILKGGSLFIAWTGSNHRVTRDIDFLKRVSSEQEKLAEIITAICAEDCPQDGIYIDPSSIKVSTIKAGQIYEGVNVKLVAYLNRTRIPIRIDVGFGDAVTPSAEIIEYPAILDLGIEQPKVLAYPKDSVVAEKFHAMVALGFLNSRMKDFYDIWLLSRTFPFQHSRLRQAIRSTFNARRTDLPRDLPSAFSEEYYADPRNTQLWESFKARALPTENPGTLAEVVQEVDRFLSPVIQASSNGDKAPSSEQWQPGKGWDAAP